jgi:hypothetical protein
MGRFGFEYSAFVVEGRPDLTLVVYNPATQADRDKLNALMESATAQHRAAMTPT